MKLKAVVIQGFRSFKKEVRLNISDRTTVLIGPNDHGKTNALLAIEKLRSGSILTTDELNSNLNKSSAASIKFVLTFSDQEAQSLQETALRQFPSESDTGLLREHRDVTASKPSFENQSVSDFRGGTLDLTVGPSTRLTPLLNGFPEHLQPSLNRQILDSMPKVTLFSSESLRQLPDAADLRDMEQNNEVMQGVFKLAGIWDCRQSLLTENTRKNEDILRDASVRLTDEIRKNWTQGRDLKFYLGYEGTNKIRLSVKDGAKTVTGLAGRSDGFTAYFAMRMLLYARTDTAKPNGYVFMFDEPGLNLHPRGQVDLQNFFEDIAQTNQIIYSTHSVFLINKNYPERNLLIFKNEDGSGVDSKPFSGGWAKVKEHLGLYLSANFLFSDKVLLVEGATDEIYLPLILQGLIAHGLFDGDMNALAIHSGLNKPEMLGSAIVCLKEHRQPAILVDGDDEGLERKNEISKWATSRNRKCPIITLCEFKDFPCSIEDFLEPVTFRMAVVEACQQAIHDEVIEQPKREGWQIDLSERLHKKSGKTLGKHLDVVTKEIFGKPISKVWIALKYGEIMGRSDQDHHAYWSHPSLLALANRIWSELDLPSRKDTAPFTS